MSRTSARTRTLQRLSVAWADWLDAHAGLTPADLLTPGVTGAWSVRDLIAHVTWWEEEALLHLPTIVAGRRPPRYSVAHGGIDAFNAKLTAQRRHLSLDEVLAQRDAVHRRLLDYLAGGSGGSGVPWVPDEHFAGETRFRRRLRFDTHGHYPKHARAVRAWRQASLHG